jgi:hypothetical protein
MHRTLSPLQEEDLRRVIAQGDLKTIFDEPKMQNEKRIDFPKLRKLAAKIKHLSEQEKAAPKEEAAPALKEATGFVQRTSTQDLLRRLEELESATNEIWRGTPLDSLNPSPCWNLGGEELLDKADAAFRLGYLKQPIHTEIRRRFRADGISLRRTATQQRTAP